MKITTFARRITKIEGKLKQVDIAQVLEILSVINGLTHGILYAVIKLMPQRSRN